jgi:transposase InsO family protein
MSQRQEFVVLASDPQANVRELCRRFGIAPATAYKWLHRYRDRGLEGLSDLSRRPQSCPRQTDPQVEMLAVTLRKTHRAWGGRKIRRRLEDLGHQGLPAPSTLTDILRRHGLIDPREASKHKPWTRFEHPQPNDLWQMDFKGDFPLQSHGRCYPLTILDDHSRFNLGLRACVNQRRTSVQPHMIDIFRRYGLPRRILADNGPPWGSSNPHALTHLGVWLIRLGIELWHGRPFHPQTQGKEERFHRSLKAEVLQGRSFHDSLDVQNHFDPWRDVYNLQRPHEALNMATPASRYQSSCRAYCESLPPIEYADDCQVRRADHQGYIRFQHHTIHVSDAVAHLPVGVRPTTQDGLWDVYFCHQKIDQIDLREQTKS